MGGPGPGSAGLGGWGLCLVPGFVGCKILQEGFCRGMRAWAGGPGGRPPNEPQPSQPSPGRAVPRPPPEPSLGRGRVPPEWGGARVWDTGFLDRFEATSRKIVESMRRGGWSMKGLWGLCLYNSSMPPCRLPNNCERATKTLVNPYDEARPTPRGGHRFWNSSSTAVRSGCGRYATAWQWVFSLFLHSSFTLLASLCMLSISFQPLSAFSKLLISRQNFFVLCPARVVEKASRTISGRHSGYQFSTRR